MAARELRAVGVVLAYSIDFHKSVHSKFTFADAVGFSGVGEKHQTLWVPPTQRSKCGFSPKVCHRRSGPQTATGHARCSVEGTSQSTHTHEISRHDLKCHTSHHNPHTQACPVAIRRADARAVRHILSARRPTDGARAPIFALQIQATGHDTTRHDTVTRVCLLSQTSHSTHTHKPTHVAPHY